MLFRRRAVWLPTWRGALLLLAVAALAVAALGHQAYDLLALNQPARGAAGQGARTLVVEGWMPPEALREAVAAVQRGRYERVLTTGGPLVAWPGEHDWHTYAARAAAYLRANGVAGIPVIAVESPATEQDRTYLMALMVREWAQRSGVRLEAIDLLSVGVHARRSRQLYRMALGEEVEVGVLAARPTEYDPQRWWASSAGAKATLGEALSVAWTACCFWPGPQVARGARQAPAAP